MMVAQFSINIQVQHQYRQKYPFIIIHSILVFARHSRKGVDLPGRGDVHRQDADRGARGQLGPDRQPRLVHPARPQPRRLRLHPGRQAVEKDKVKQFGALEAMYRI